MLVLSGIPADEPTGGDLYRPLLGTADQLVISDDPLRDAAIAHTMQLASGIPMGDINPRINLLEAAGWPQLGDSVQPTVVVDDLPTDLAA